MRLADILFTQGFGSRRECAEIVLAGRVTIDGVQVRDPSQPVGPDLQGFEVDGRYWPRRNKAMLMLHKPAGFECSQKPSDHPSVMSLLPTPLRVRGVQPVGRLDVDTTGLLLLTDDGALLHRLSSPRHHVTKVYEARLKHDWRETDIEPLLAGLLLRDDPRPARALAARLLSPRLLELTLAEGRYHQVKRMVAAAGNRVEALHRSAFGALKLDAALAPGQWRWLEHDEALQLGNRAPS